MSDFDPLHDYDAGLRGAWIDPREDEICADSIIRHGGDPDGSSVAHAWEFADKGKGQLVSRWENVMRVWPGCWPGPPQGRGDCVSWALMRAALTSWTCEIIDGRPDEVSGVVEGKPEVSPDGVKNCVLASEAAYWWRGFGGEGWTCSGAARAITNDCGIWIRQPYPEVRLDLTKYNDVTAGKWGSAKPPDEIRNIGRQHLVRTATFLKSVEEIRDFLYAGYGCYFCSMLKWSNARDENGFSPVVVGSWAHAQGLVGFDDRPETIASAIRIGRPARGDEALAASRAKSASAAAITWEHGRARTTTATASQTPTIDRAIMSEPPTAVPGRRAAAVLGGGLCVASGAMADRARQLRFCGRFGASRRCDQAKTAVSFIVRVCAVNAAFQRS